MKVGDLVKYASHVHTETLYGIVVEFDHVAEGALCFIKGESMWLRTNQIEVISESR